MKPPVKSVGSLLSRHYPAFALTLIEHEQKCETNTKKDGSKLSLLGNQAWAKERLKAEDKETGWEKLGGGLFTEYSGFF